MIRIHLRLRTLLVVTTLTAIAMLAAYRPAMQAFRTWWPQEQTIETETFTTVHTSVTIPDGGTTLGSGSGIRTIKADRSE